jgi:NAD(P)-dependent dehydrogenase (short-subunit alcohol dehydrogenase family)
MQETITAEVVRTSRRLAGRVAVVTGASSGVGRAIALALAREGAEVCAIGRNSGALSETVAAVRGTSLINAFTADLTVERDVKRLKQHVDEVSGKLDILVHSAGVIHQDTLRHASIGDFDAQYAINVRAPYLMTQCMLPLLERARGQIVFINSSVGLSVKRADVGQYAATKHALKAIADSLREEVNSKGIRVLTAYLGRTATPMQEALCRQERQAYQPDILLQPEDVASVVLHTLLLPPRAEVTDISIRPMIKRL